MHYRHVVNIEHQYEVGVAHPESAFKNHLQRPLVEMTPLLFMAYNKTFLVEKKQTLLLKNFHRLLTVVRPTMTHRKQQQYFWQPIVSRQFEFSYWSTHFAHGLIREILLNLNVSPHFWKYIALAASNDNDRPTLKAFLLAPQLTEAIHVVGLAIQNWSESYCNSSTTVHQRSRSYETMTQSNSVNLADAIQLIRLL